MIRVTVNGCFDGLHPGHLFMLGYARALGNELIVGINSDQYIRQHKGTVMFNEQERKLALEKLGFVSRVVIFREQDPVKFILAVRPDVHCTGQEYENGKCVEASWCELYGIKLVYVPRVGDWSSTKERWNYETQSKLQEVRVGEWLSQPLCVGDGQPKGPCDACG
jgi:D-beta-D-heptose 7-phosphate kinase/D-beta-D-heptose 1-phosphate adenosyltransferase